MSSWFEQEKRDTAALAAQQQGTNVAGITDAITVEVTKGAAEDSEPEGDGA